jgi:hypothetical protein
MKKIGHSGLFILIAWHLALSACAPAYYATLEKFGIEKRDILTDRVDDARKAQANAKEQFEDALDRYREVVNINGGNLETIYGRLNASFKKSESRAAAVTERIEEIQSVADDLFTEWEAEIGDYSDASLRRHRSSRAPRRPGDAGLQTHFHQDRRVPGGLRLLCAVLAL